MGPRHHDAERRHREDLPGLQRVGEPAEALGRHVVQPTAADRSVAQPAVGRAGQLRTDPEKEDTPRQQITLLSGGPVKHGNISNTPVQGHLNRPTV